MEKVNISFLNFYNISSSLILNPALSICSLNPLPLPMVVRKLPACSTNCGNEEPNGFSAVQEPQVWARRQGTRRCNTAEFDLQIDLLRPSCELSLFSCGFLQLVSLPTSTFAFFIVGTRYSLLRSRSSIPLLKDNFVMLLWLQKVYISHYLLILQIVYDRFAEVQAWCWGTLHMKLL